jgi:hypothetical protein
VVPPRSDRVSRAPPYSRTPARPCPYGAVTRYGAPFQTLPVRKAEATGLVRVRSSLLTESRVDVLSSGYLDISVRRVRLLPLSIHDRIPPKGWVAPFGDLGITGRSPLPRAFRSVPRPSSPLGAKASTRCPSRARPRPAPRPRFPALSWSPACGSPLPGQRAPAYLHTHARARPIRRARPEGRGGLSCHARFTVTTRFTMSKRHHGLRLPLPGRRAPISCPGDSAGWQTPSPISPTPAGGPGPIRTADLTLIRRAL